MKYWPQKRTGYFGSEHMVLTVLVITFLLHLLDELANQANTPNVIVYIVVALTYLLYPLGNLPIRGLLAIGAGIGQIAGFSINHLIPYFQSGYDEGIVTAVIGIAVAVYTIYFGVKLLVEWQTTRK